MITVIEVCRKAESDKLVTERILAEERIYAQKLAVDKAEADEGIRGLTRRIEILEQEVRDKSALVEQTLEAENKAVDRAERAEKDKKLSDEKALLTLGLTNDCCASAKRSEALQTERERAEKAEQELERALQTQKEQQDGIERLRAEKAKRNDAVVVRLSEPITPAEDEGGATSTLRRSKRRKRASLKVYDQEQEFELSEPSTKRVKPLPEQLKQLFWAEWEEGEESSLIRFNLQVSVHCTAEGHDDARPGSCCIKCIRYEDESVISNHEIAALLEMLYRKTFNQEELSIIGQTFRRHTFRTITSSKYNDLFEAEVGGPIILVLWQNFAKFIMEVVAGFHDIS
ncbi:hypothetical protein PG993_010797 [Apiospora rasikravindrae]|uniref:Uncharacterized protein n=1 Tax=Apiospora rasikravindrae TaxID=990691 RepID=A0ABR1SCP0_9PEZI